MPRERRRHRTFSGCWKCRSRKIKCDEARPGCLACSRIGVVCSGYGARFIWVGHDASQPYRSDGRRMLPSESTWANFDILPSDVVDTLLSQCDEDQTPSHSLASQAHSSWTPNFHNPFSVFSLDQAPASEASNTPELLCQLPQSVDPLASISHEERFLFHHYAGHVAGMMLPYEHPRNPWKSHYPAAALQLASSGKKALFRAMLAHSAFNITHLRGNDASMAEIGVRHYTAAIADLASSLQNKGADFPAMLASIMSLLMAEAYRGHGPDWKHHLRGAQSLLPLLHQTEAGALSELGCLSLQSFSIIEVVADTSAWNSRSDARMEAEGRSSSLAWATPEFCFTIGAPRSILECIAKITQFSCQADIENPSAAKDELMQEVLLCLSTAKNNVFIAEDDPPEARHQTRAFVSATYIYCYRTLLDAPPHAVRHHVHDTLTHVFAFFASSAGNFSLWPAFIAAAEAYTEEDLKTSKEWLSWATSVGIGSRASLQHVLQEVWHRREVMSERYGLDAGKVVVDWRQVMHELGCDILLI